LRRTSWRIAAAIVAVAVAFLSGYLADQASGRPFLVGLIAVAGFGASSVVLYMTVLLRVFRKPAHEAHWTPQVFHAEPDYAGIEFDLWSNCIHELYSARSDVIEPDGRLVRGLTNEPPQGALQRGGYISGGTYPVHYPDAAPVRFGAVYTVVWTAKRFPDSRDVEIARQQFELPIVGRRLVGQGNFRPPPFPGEHAGSG
jgi:hypothetical protein